MEAAMGEWLDLVDGTGLTGIMNTTRASFTNTRRSRRRVHDDNTIRRSARPEPETFNIAPRTCDMEIFQSKCDSTTTDGKSTSHESRRSSVKKSLLQALGDLALEDEVDTCIADVIDEHVKDGPLPSQLADYYLERNARRKSGRKVATTNLAALQEIVAKANNSDKVEQEETRVVKSTHREIVNTGARRSSTKAIEALSGDLGNNIDWESELNQAVLNEIASSFRKQKSQTALSSSNDVQGEQNDDDDNVHEKNLHRSSSLKMFVKHISLVKQISANLASECTDSTATASDIGLGSSFPQLSISPVPCSSTQLECPSRAASTTNQKLPPTHSEMDRRLSLSNNSYLQSEQSETSTDAQGSCPSDMHRPSKRSSMGMVGLEIIVETPNENGTVASKSKSSTKEAVHRVQQHERVLPNASVKTIGGRPASNGDADDLHVSTTIPNEIQLKATSPSSSRKQPKSPAGHKINKQARDHPPRVSAQQAAAIEHKKIDPLTPMPPVDAGTSTRFGTMHHPWPELRGEESYRQKVDSSLAVRESKIRFLSRQVSQLLAHELEEAISS